MKFASFASGSSGNCEFISDGKCNILIDAGISTKRIVDGLCGVGTSPEDVCGILITHEHSDHIQGINVFCGKYKKPIYATYNTLKAIEENDKQHKLDTSLFHVVQSDEAFNIGEMKITPHSISHDAADPVCYRIDSDGRSIGMATDLGTYDSYIVEKLSGCNTLFIEANYDVAMLQAGKYPFYLKKRILSDHGHLSNDMSARLILELLGRNVNNIILAHLSKENNYPQLAYETVKYELAKEYGDTSRFNMQTAHRSCPSDVINI